MSLVNTVDLAAQIPKIVAARYLQRIRNKTVMAMLARRDFENEVAGYGDTVNVPIPPTTYTSNLLTDGDPVTQQSRALGNAQVVLNRHREITFAITDVGRALARPDVALIHMDQAAAKMGDDVDSDVLGIYASFTTAAVGTYGSSLTEAVIQAARTALIKAKAPPDKPLFMVVSPDAFQDLVQIVRFTESRVGGPAMDGAVLEGRLGAYEAAAAEQAFRHGRIAGFNVYEDQGVPITTGVPDQHHCIAFSPDATLLVFRPVPPPIPGTGALGATVSVDGYSVRVVTTYSGANLGQQWTADVLYGYAVGRSAFGLEVKR